MHIVLSAVARVVALDWPASAVGAVGGFGIALALVGSIALIRTNGGSRHRRRNR
jgi:hypothetical protein